jgi:biotin synthase
MSVGIRTESDYQIMRAAGADRYLLKHETSDPLLFSRLRPGTSLTERIEHLRTLKRLGFQVGSGNMVGLPGQTVDSLAGDIMLLRELDVEMAGIGPFISHPHTPLGGESGGDVPATLRTLAVARLVLPYAHLPATTALGSIDPQGRQKALRCGANVVMPDITPVKYKQLYEIYPNKICLTEGSTQCIPCLSGVIKDIGRTVDTGYGHAVKRRAGRVDAEPILAECQMITEG